MYTLNLDITIFFFSYNIPQISNLFTFLFVFFNCLESRLISCRSTQGGHVYGCFHPRGETRKAVIAFATASLFQLDPLTASSTHPPLFELYSAPHFLFTVLIYMNIFSLPQFPSKHHGRRYWSSTDQYHFLHWRRRSVCWEQQQEQEVSWGPHASVGQMGFRNQRAQEEVQNLARHFPHSRDGGPSPWRGGPRHQRPIRFPQFPRISLTTSTARHHFPERYPSRRRQGSYHELQSPWSPSPGPNKPIHVFFKFIIVNLWWWLALRPSWSLFRLKPQWRWASLLGAVARSRSWTYRLGFSARAGRPFPVEVLLVC